MARFCTNCGSELTEGAKFCTNCGAPIAAMDVPTADPIEEFKDNNPVPTPGPEIIPTVAEEMPEPAPAPEPTPAPEPSAAYTPAPEEIPEPEFATGPAASAPVYAAPAPAAPAEGMKERNVALCIVLSVVTCGIYGFYWLYKLNEEINALAGEENATSGGLVILFTVITCGIYGWYWNYKMGERVDRIKQTGGDSNKVLFIVLAIFGLSIVNYAIMQDTLNDRVNA